MDGPIWGGNLRLARVLAATIPSGDANVVRLREDLITIVDIPETFPVLPVQWVTPVIDITIIERPWPVQYIYVGHGPHGCGSNPSPWGSPYSDPSVTTECGDADLFLAYANDRADLLTWLSPLVGKV